MCINCPTCVGEEIREKSFGYKRDSQGNIMHQPSRTPLQAKLQAAIEQRRFQLFGYMRDASGEITKDFAMPVLQAKESPQCPRCFCPLAEHC